MESALHDPTATSDDRLKSITRTFLHFCLLNRNMYTLFFMAKGSRVDEETPQLEVQRIRNHLFGLLRQAIAACLPSTPDTEQVLAYTRIYFYTLHGIVGTYTDSEEQFDQLTERLAPTFGLAVDVLLAGIKQNADKGENSK
jgi:hypothetical protein